MNKIVPVLLTAGLIGAMTVPSAQTSPSKVGYIFSLEVLKAHPKGAAANDLKAQYEKDLKPMADQINSLRTKVATGTASAQERQTLDTLVKTAQARAKTWQDKIQAALKPIEGEVDKAVQQAAKANGFAIVLDGLVAQQSGLVVYADSGADLTQEVIQIIKK